MLWAVLMAGGRGTRFWPESRNKNPKQFLKIFGKATLLEQTLARLGNVVPPSRVLVVTQQEKVSTVAKLLKRVPRSHIIGEPVGRNTAPCAALAAAVVFKKDPHAVILLLPADQRVKKIAAFQKALRAAEKLAWGEKLPVTFGIKPNHPHTGYGYLELGPSVKIKDTPGVKNLLHPGGVSARFHPRGGSGGVPVYRLKRFREKPTLEKAKAYLKSRRFLWNSGMFIWRADELLNATRRYLPRAYRLVKKITAHDLKHGMKRFYAAMPDVSIDYGLMEKMGGRILTMPLDIGWQDVGSWHSLAELWPQDACQNVTLGKTILVDSSGNIVKAKRRLVALVGVDDHVVVDTEDVLLICPKHKTESIREIVHKLKEKKWKEYL